MNRVNNNAISPMGLDGHNGALRAVYPIRDALLFIHGSIGCNLHPRFMMALHDNYRLRMLSSGTEGKHVIFGGNELLEEGLEKAADTFRPALIVIQNTCIPTLIGDDSEGVARSVSRKKGIKIISTNNPNYKGNQLEGYINVVKHYITDLMEGPREKRSKSVNLLGMMPGEYNWCSDQREIVRLLEGLGLSVNCILVGDGTSVKEIMEAPSAEANVLLYPEVGAVVAELMQERFGTPFIKTDFPPVGVESTKEWLFKIADFFNLHDQCETLVEQELMGMGAALSKLEEGQIYGLEFFFGRTYAIEAASFRIPGMVKFLWEDLSMYPTTIAFQEFDDYSLAKLQEVIRDNGLFPEVQTSGDHTEFLESVKKNHVYPYGDPWFVLGSTMDALNLAFSGERLPVIRFSYPVFDESIITDRPFLGFRGVVFLTERIYNTISFKIWYTGNATGNFQDPFQMAEEITKAMG